MSLSLRLRLTGLVAVGAVVTALAAVAGFSWLDLRRLREHAAAEVSAVADIVADQSGPAVMLADRKAATEILASLRMDASIRQATLYGNGNGCFAKAESEPGRGSNFFVELPLRVSTSGTAAEAQVKGAAAVPLPMLHILVAEDNVVNQKVLSSLLKRQGWTMVLTSDGAQALARFRTERFDVLLLDVQMPELDGLEATVLIRQEEQHSGLRRTPIVAVTAHASRAQHDQCIAAGMDAVVTKPIDPALLRRTIGAVLGVGRGVQQLA